jgi:CRP-like cAMP-binding protein
VAVASPNPSELASVPLFAGISDSELVEIAGWFEVKDVDAGARLAGEGTTGNAFFVIGAGGATVATGGTELAALGPGDFFGELALLGSVRRTATVTTTAPSRILVMFGNDFARLRSRHPRVADELDATMERRLGRP